jgi:hypothetical protein
MDAIRIMRLAGAARARQRNGAVLAALARRQDRQIDGVELPLAL